MEYVDGSEFDQYLPPPSAAFAMAGSRLTSELPHDPTDCARDPSVGWSTDSAEESHVPQVSHRNPASFFTHPSDDCRHCSGFGRFCAERTGCHYYTAGHWSNTFTISWGCYSNLVLIVKRVNLTARQTQWCGFTAYPASAIFPCTWLKEVVTCLIFSNQYKVTIPSTDTAYNRNVPITRLLHEASSISVFKCTVYNLQGNDVLTLQAWQHCMLCRLSADELT